MGHVKQPGGWILVRETASDGALHQTKVRAVRGGGATWVSVDGATLKVADAPRTSRRSKGGSSSAELEAAFVAQFPGKVTKLLVAEGAEVEAGQPLLVVEAMKMEFAIKAPVAGKLVKFKVGAGQAVTPGTRLVEFEPVSDARGGAHG